MHGNRFKNVFPCKMNMLPFLIPRKTFTLCFRGFIILEKVGKRGFTLTLYGYFGRIRPLIIC